MNEADVYISKIKEAQYPRSFDPSELYPELSRLNYKITLNDSNNEIYSSVREILINLGFDKDNIGKDIWNPLRGFVKEGQSVFIKPNLVRGDHPNGDKDVASMITNASLIRPVIDYLLLATNGNVNIIIGDVPLQDCNWEHVTRKSGLLKLIKFYKDKGIDIKLIDMRLKIAHKNEFDIIDYKEDNFGRTENMYSPVDLGRMSELIDIINKSNNFEITDYGKGTVSKHHNDNHNEYFIPNEILQADVFINMPKLKTHRKAGITCALKNLIGINGDKSWIAHHTRGVKSGDEFSKFNVKLMAKVRLWNWLKCSVIGVKVATLIKWFFQKYIWHGKTYKQISSEGKDKVFFEGSWYGNDTLWRCIKDLNKIILYADKNGIMKNKIQRKYLCIVDAVLAGEGEGPMEQRTKEFGVLFGGLCATYVDYTACKLMKYDYKNIPSVKNAFINRWWELAGKEPEEIVISSNIDLDEISSYFTPSAGWKKVLYEVTD